MNKRVKDILVIGSKIFTILGAAVGTDTIESTSLSCNEIHKFVKENINKYGAIIIDDNVFSKCDALRKYLIEIDVLVVVAPTPEQLGKIDIKKYYEKLVGETIGMRIGLD